MLSLTCHACGHQQSLPSPPGRRDECPKCRADLHVCKNCQHYESTAYNECREPVAERVQEKDRSNFCDHFVVGGPRTAKNDRESLRAAAEALFKKGK
jgi:hypothetical protein